MSSFRPTLALALVQLACSPASAPEDAGTPPADAGMTPGDGGALPWSALAALDVSASAQFMAPGGVASDPNVLLDGTTYRMVYTCLDAATSRDDICEATSSDGLSWANVPSGVAVPGLVLAGVDASWDQAVETAALIKSGSTYFLFYAGKLSANALQYQIGVATSSDGLTFARTSLLPIVTLGAAGTADALSAQHPNVVRLSSTQWVMTYTCIGSGSVGGVGICLATSSDGMAWTKQGLVMQGDASVSWRSGGVGESGALIRGTTDGLWYLFFTGFDEASGVGVDLGVARSASLMGPWDFDPQPLVANSAATFSACCVFTPTVRVEAGVLRLWYVGVAANAAGYAIGYAHGAWPY
jgi:hypothetical protein